MPEDERLGILASYPVDGSERRAKLDRIARLAAQVCEAPIGLVSLVHADRQVFVGRTGIEATETPRDVSFCAIAMQGSDQMVVPDTLADRRFARNPLVTDDPRIRFYAGQPLRSSEGAPLGTLCIIDQSPRTALTEEQQETLATLADAVMALLEHWRTEDRAAQFQLRTENELHNLEQRFEVLADNLPQLVWSTAADGYSDYFNRGWCDYVGAPAERSFGKGWLDFLHPDDLPVADAAWRAAVASGEPYEIEYRLRDKDGRYRWMLTLGMPVRQRDGHITRWIGTCTNIDEHRRAMERESLLAREMNHRVKNIFAVIGGLVAISTRQSPQFKQVGDDLRERILALGRAHDLVRIASLSTDRAEGETTLHALIGSLLAPYGDGDQRFAVLGDDAPVDDRSATPLALLIHELATNATKYGAFSVADGRVTVTITAGDETTIVWSETGGPTAEINARPGFGEQLIDLAVRRQLGGDVEYDWRPQGLQLTARIPSGSLAR